MRHITLWVLLCCALANNTFGQAKTRRLSSIINHPSLDVYAPYISFDGNALLFVANSGQDGALTTSYTSRETDWTVPTELPKYLLTRLNYLKGYALSADGKRLYFTCAKSPVIGGYDIFTSELKNGTWTQPENLMLPINSKTNDGCPSFTPDGSTLYFMRCDKMDQNKADRCKLFRAKKKSNGQWEEPVALPDNINTGNAQTPRIMADGETLIFSSNKAGGKGGMDLYLTKAKGDEWTEPVPLDFVNTDKDDQFVSVAALGRYLLKEAPGARKNSEITEFLIPNELRPRGMMKVEGKVSDDTGAPVAAYVSATDLATNKRAYSGRPAADGTYSLYLLEGSKYELSFDPEQSNLTFFAKPVDLTTDKVPQREKLNVTLKQPAPGDEMVLNLVTFKPYSAQLEPASENDLKKLARTIKANPALKFEIQVLLNGYEEDSVKSSPDLTETIVDSVVTQVNDIDTLGQPVKRESVLTKTLYHNDRTEQQAQAVITYLAQQGVDAGKLTFFRNAIEAMVPENKKLTVKAVAR